jgi:hypothetical protein
VVVEDEGFHVRVGRTERGWERPWWVKEEDAVRAERLAMRLQKVLDEFNENNARFKARLDLRYCKPSVCNDVRVFYDANVYERGSGEQVATITYEWNMTDDRKSFVFVVADTDEHLTTLENTQNILFLAGKLATEFYS